VTIGPQLRELVLRASERLMNEAANEAKLMTAEASPAPNSGDLARSIAVSDASGDSTLTVQIVATAPYASFTDTGTGIYPPGGRGSPIVAADYGHRAFVFHWASFNAPNGPGDYAFAKVNGTPAQLWWIVHHPERWPEALASASQRGAFSAD
jgi:hypothetical protein